MLSTHNAASTSATSVRMIFVLLILVIASAKLRKVESKTKKLVSFFAETEYLRRCKRQSYEKTREKPGVGVIITTHRIRH